MRITAAEVLSHAVEDPVANWTKEDSSAILMSCGLVGDAESQELAHEVAFENFFRQLYFSREPLFEIGCKLVYP